MVGEAAMAAPGAQQDRQTSPPAATPNVRRAGPRRGVVAAWTLPSGAGSAGADSAGRDSAGRDSAGRDSAGRDSAGRDSAGRDSADGDPDGARLPQIAHSSRAGA